MNAYKNLVRPIAFKFPAVTAHKAVQTPYRS